MKKIQVDNKPDQLLHLNNGYKIAAATYIIGCVMENIEDCTSHLNIKERDRVNKEVDKLLEGIMSKRHKWHTGTNLNKI